MKICTKCLLKKDLNLFTKTKKTKDGYYASCKSCRKVYYQENKEKIIKKSKNWYLVNIDKKRNYDREYRKKNETLVKKRKIEYSKNNRIRINAKAKLRKQNDIQYKLALHLRNRINCFIKKNVRPGSAVKDLGCTLGEFKLYIESKFQPGMSWENYGLYGWHIDHIYPLSKVDLTNKEQFLKACHYTNLQPLWAKDNLKKKNKIISY